MWPIPSVRIRSILLTSGVTLFASMTTPAQETSETWDVTNPGGNTRVVDFTTDEGTCPLSSILLRRSCAGRCCATSRQPARWPPPGGEPMVSKCLAP